MYTLKGLLARSARGRLFADRDQSIAPAIKRMTCINDFHLFGSGYVIVTLMGIKSATDMAAAERRLNQKCWTTWILGRHKSLNL